ncbi:stage III sporulation protein AE [Solibacillus silvestris]|uniref:stage III sporulation protein AE n=1 Tax=Solibacillus silvestris TaxID=76853 RepID=UPI003F80695A
METFFSIFTEPFQSLLFSIVLVAVYVLLYLLLLALVPSETAIIEQLFIILFIVVFAQNVVDAFVVLYELIALLQNFFLAILPIMTFMLLTIQTVFTAIAWNPIIILFIQIILFVSTKALIPGLVLALLFDICTKIYPAISFTKAAELIRSSILSIMIASVVALTSILTLSGIAFIQLNDALKSPIKKLIEQNIPLIGNLIVEGLSFFQKTQSTVSTFVGLSFLTIIWGAAFYPAIILMLHALLFKTIGAIIEPFTNMRMSSLFDDVGKSLFVLCAVAFLLGFAIMFIVLLFIFFMQMSTGGKT